MTLLSRYIGSAAFGMLVMLWLSQPTDRLTGATVVLSSCGLYHITTTHDSGELRDYPEYPGDELVRAVQALPEEKLVLVVIPCPVAQTPQYEAQKQDRPQSAQAAPDSPQGDVAHRSPAA